MNPKAMAAGRGRQPADRPAVGRPPIPREHGAWVILYAPLVAGFAVSGRFEPAPALLLVLAVTGLYLARNAADVVLRRRDQTGARFWLIAFLAAAAAGGAPLLAAYHRFDLLFVGAAVVAVYGVHSALSQRRMKKRFDRTAVGELLAVAALVSTAPAAVIVVRGALDPLALHLWLLCALFFGSGVLHVNMHLDAAKIRGEMTAEHRQRISRPSLAYHTFLALVYPVAAFLALGSTAAAAIAFAGVAPALVRAFAGAATLNNVLPSLKRVGLHETLYSVWFLVCLTAAFTHR